MSVPIGEVVSVSGVRIGIKVFENSNKETLFYHGDIYKGVSIREYIVLRRGFVDIVCIVEGEFLDEKVVQKDNDYIIRYVRRIEVKSIGYFRGGVFYEGIKFMPMIKDTAYLLPEKDISKIFSKGEVDEFCVGALLKDGIRISLPWGKIFNSHIGIFGNTGSGKSNTLAKVYTELFDKKINSIKDKSKFVIFDFNGEYLGSQLISGDEKKSLRLSTNRGSNSDRFKLPISYFWDMETMSILFRATQGTQRPFLNRVIEGRNKNPDGLKGFLIWVFKRVFETTSPKSESLEILLSIGKIINNKNLNDILLNIKWFSNSSKFFTGENPKRRFFNSGDDAYDVIFRNTVDELNLDGLDAFDQIILRSWLKLCADLINGYVQFEYIQPLLKRMEASLNGLKKVIEIVDDGYDFEKENWCLQVISFRECNGEIKKIIPLLISKYYYSRHRSDVESPPNKTLHFIIDEAHNILSEQSSGEREAWREYRIELFEEIIKEGRKFGVFITLSSQRPSDISPTLVSQLHNYFVHRLVNEKDLFLIDNTINTLDQMSRSLIPSLARGCCVVTGTAFDLPMVLQIDQLSSDRKPDSDDVNLKNLWV